MLYLSFVSRPSLQSHGQFQPLAVLPFDENTLTVITLNMLHDYPEFSYLQQRIALVQDALQVMEPDIVLLQEVPWRPDIGYAAQMLANGEFAWAYARANGNRYLLRFEEGEAILSRYPLEVVEVHELKPQSRPLEHRIVLHARAHFPQGDLDLFVTHLTHRNAQVNAAQAAELYRYVEAAAGDASALIVGDFNAQPDEPSLQHFSGWVDLFLQAHPNDPGFTCCVNNVTSTSAAPNKRVDYIFFRPGTSAPFLSVDEVNIILNQPIDTPDGLLWLSDHFGLLARMRLSAKE
ncbi:MAG: endonuclease/exonuclease/phosphatase family protein [Anaerolineales bacterium]|nr:endonuclease/exonuclease/phosphatase family protein [Chloroflexota bacterium]MBL6981871.1 endonuclease/exonuclease/phosphatase family protein [Anaerolineales bacterium]